MKIRTLEIAGFRGIPALKLEFSGQVNVLAGVNGAGKSAVLDCIAIMLSRLLGRIRSSTGTGGTGRFFTELDISNQFHHTQNEIVIHSQGEIVRWCVQGAERIARDRPSPGSTSCADTPNCSIRGWRRTKITTCPLPYTILSTVQYWTFHYASGRNTVSNAWQHTIKRCPEVRPISGYSSSGSGNARIWRTSTVWIIADSAILC